ncbi:hypothetical protein GWK47_044616 [Chionoecetes opilio]|uniref:Uncharacterized protein n=1 Tax=Chionoecetes opilio TaxID=41210 RepID=A0A8J4Y7Y8_CHIOP|nr:hypothetical protein GWK47_044616 [Chionoecetes opilio]
MSWPEEKHWDPSKPAPTMADFDKKLTGSNAYLQLLIELSDVLEHHTHDTHDTRPRPLPGGGGWHQHSARVHQALHWFGVCAGRKSVMLPEAIDATTHDHAEPLHTPRHARDTKTLVHFLHFCTQYKLLQNPDTTEHSTTPGLLRAVAGKQQYQSDTYGRRRRLTTRTQGHARAQTGTQLAATFTRCR